MRIIKMKFGKQLLFHIIPEWSGRYFPYDDLKRILKAVKARKKKCPRSYEIAIHELQRSVKALVPPQDP